MYCAGCGSSLSEGLNYCKNCGKRLAETQGAAMESWVLKMFVIAFGVIALVGIGALIALVAMLLDRGATEKVVVMTIVFYLVAFTGIEFILGTQISKLINASLEKKNAPPHQYQPQTAAQPNQLFAPNTAQLKESTQTPVGSVTENTTRFFEKVPVKE